jgi:hypothetical protein
VSTSPSKQDLEPKAKKDKYSAVFDDSEDHYSAVGSVSPPIINK